ncbi:MAG: hypothetical protein ACI38Q_00730 [Candidatus Bruticola sp.]
MHIYDRTCLSDNCQVSADKAGELSFGISLLEKVQSCLETLNIPLLKLSNLCSTGRIFIVGGALRNLAWNYPVKDWDLIIEGGKPHDVALLSRRFCDVFGAAWVVLDRERGFYRAVFANEHTEVDFCALRGSSLEEDLLDRDFTINSLAYSLSEGVIYDEKRSLSDLCRRRLVPVSPSCLLNDPLRALRALRLGLAYRLTWESKLTEQVAEILQSGIYQVAAERIGIELAAVLQCSLTEQLKLLIDCAFPQFLLGRSAEVSANTEIDNCAWPLSWRVSLLSSLEREQKTGWRKLKHSGTLLQRYLNVSVKGGRSFLVLIKMALLCPWEHLEKKDNRFKLSAQELIIISELKQAAPELFNLLGQKASRRQFYNFFTKIKFFPCLVALNYLWVLTMLQKKNSEGCRLSFWGNWPWGGKRAFVANSGEKLFPACEYASFTLYLDCLLLDYLKGGTLSCPIVPVNGRLLQEELGLGPGPQLGKLLKALASECSEHFLSKEEALSWAKEYILRYEAL